MQVFLKRIQKELNRAIYNLARQDFNSVVENIEYVNNKIKDILSEKFFYGFDEKMTNKEILQKYPEMQLVTRKGSIDLFYNKTVKTGAVEDSVFNNKERDFIVEKGIDINTGEIKKISIYSFDSDKEI